MSWFIEQCVSYFLCLVLSFLTRLPFPQHKYLISNLRPVPLDMPSPSPEPELRVQVPVFLRTKTPPPAPRTTMPFPQKGTTPTANPAANTPSSNVQASGSAPFNISKPPLPRFLTLSTTPQMVQSSLTQKVMKPQLVTSKSSQSSHAVSSSQMTLAKSVDTLKSGPPLPPGTLFVGFDKPTVDDNLGWVSLPCPSSFSANDFCFS